MPLVTVTQNPNPNSTMLPYQLKPPVTRGSLLRLHISRTLSPTMAAASSLKPLRYAVLGAGFAGLSVSWHLLQQSPKDLNLQIDIYDEFGIGGGASGVSGGLLHPYSPKVKPLWRGEECWKESLRLLSIAEAAVGPMEFTAGDRVLDQSSNTSLIVRRRGILRPAVSLKNIDVMNDNVQNCLASCRIESIDKNTAQKLVPSLFIPFNSAFYMPEAVNVHPQRYLEALYIACENLVKNALKSSSEEKEIQLHKKSINSLIELAGEYDAVIVCTGARTASFPELSGRLPLRTCRGVIAHLQLPDDEDNRETYPENGPSILSDSWLAIRGSRELHMGSTWEWNSTNYYQNVPEEEASKAMEELVPKASAVYPAIKKWRLTGAKAGLRAMPPLTSHGSLPLLGRIDDLVGGSKMKENGCKFWLFTGLGSRGLLYHGWLGKLLAKAVISCNEDVIPSELLDWRSKIRR